MNWTKNRTRAVTTLALSVAFALPTAAWGQQQNQQQEKKGKAAQQDENTKTQQDKQTRKENQRDKRKLQVFELQHRTPQQLTQIIALARYAESDDQADLNTIDQQFARRAALRYTSGYRGAGRVGQGERDDKDHLLTAIDEQKQILFVRGSDDQIAKAKKLVDAFDVEQKKLKQQNIGKLSVVPVPPKNAAQIRTTLSQLELESGILQMGEVSLVVFRNDNETSTQAEKVIKTLCEDKMAEQKKKDNQEKADAKKEKKNAEASKQDDGDKSQDDKRDSEG